MDYICYPFGYLMKWCWELVHNYGFAIILFTLVTKLLLLPLSVWVHKNSIKMVRMQPEINFLKVRYYGDKDRILEEENKLHKREKYNPLINIIPLALQIILLFAVLYIIKEPLTHIFHISDDVLKLFAGFNNMNLDYRADQLAIIRAVQDGTIPMTISDRVDVVEAMNLIKTFDLDFIGIRLDNVASQVWGWYTLVPFVAAASAYLLCYVQNKANVLQMEQSKLNKYGMTALSVGLSLYLGFFVYTGVALYWVAGNIFAVIQQLLLNAAINPKKHVDYEQLEKSREELRKIEAVGAENKKDADYREHRKREKADCKRFFKIVNKHVVIWSERSGFYKYYEALIDGLLSGSNLVVHYITNDPDDAIFKKAETEPRIKPYYVSIKKLITVMMRMDADMVIMTTPDLQNYYIKRSLVRRDTEYIFVPHDMMSVHMGFRKGSLDYFDTIFATGPHVEREVRATEKRYNLPEKTIVKFGYPLAEKLEAAYESKPQQSGGRKEILIAPSWQEDNLLDSCVDTLISRLICDEYHVTVRPHPEYSKRYKEKLNALVEKYKDVPEEKLSFELDFTVNKSIYSSDLLITDWSGIAYEFAFATKKPVLFVNTKMKVENPDWQEIGETPAEIYLRPQIGHALEKSELEDGVKAAADDLIAHSAEYHDKINELKLCHLYSYNTNGAEGVRYILRRLSEMQKQRKENK
ncbi:MAG: membrane protein insertase YidC [Clostridia bacterium]|nr:membrane protein insertase YidC [Clostridia bacterium]